MNKSTDAFRTISEVAGELKVPKHVLRFWEAKFPQIKPMKRGGGRRYYRPEDLELLRGIRHLLHADGYTIKGVQKILREQGIDAVKDNGRNGGASPAKGKRRGKRAPSSQGRPTLVAGQDLAGRRQAAQPPAASAPADAISEIIRELESCRELLLARRSEGRRTPRGSRRQRAGRGASA